LVYHYHCYMSIIISLPHEHHSTIVVSLSLLHQHRDITAT